MRRTFAFLVPLLLGAGVFGVLKLTEREPVRRETPERVHPLRVVTVAPTEVVPRVVGHGRAQPGRTWRAVARVEGRVIELADGLRDGGRVAAGDVLARLDPREYELGIQRAEAESARLEAELAQLDVREENDRASLALEQASLELATDERERLAALRAQGDVSQSQLDDVRREELRQRQTVQGLENGLALLPVQRRSLEASLAAQRAVLEDARLDLAHTEIAAPFGGVLSDVEVDVGQFVGRGETLLVVLGSDRAEVDAQFLYGEARRVIGPRTALRMAEALAAGRSPGQRATELVEAVVRMRSGGLEAEWPAEIVGLREEVGEATHAYYVRVAVADPYAKAVPGERPPLLRGTFCSVELRGERLPDRIVLPRSAVRSGGVWVLDDASRLSRRDVDVAFTQGDFAVIADGLEPGERVVVSDTGTAPLGALVEPSEDAALVAELAARAGGQGALR